MEPMEIGLITTFEEGIEATARKVNSLGIGSIQYLYLPEDGRSKADINRINTVLGLAGIRVSGLFCTFAEMDYSTIPKSVETGGLVPLRYRKERFAETMKLCDLAQEIGASAVILHYGALPEDQASHDYPDLIDVTQQLCDHCREMRLTLNLETGEDTSETLLTFIRDVDRPNLGINFDPANMILYGTGNPIEALQQVGSYVLSCHCKDAVWSSSPGIEWGEEVTLGTGEVDIERFIRTLHRIDYRGPLTIEREIHGEKQIGQIRLAKSLLENIKAGLV